MTKIKNRVPWKRPCRTRGRKRPRTSCATILSTPRGGRRGYALFTSAASRALRGGFFERGGVRPAGTRRRVVSCRARQEKRGRARPPRGHLDVALLRQPRRPAERQGRDGVKRRAPPMATRIERCGLPRRTSVVGKRLRLWSKAISKYPGSRLPARMRQSARADRGARRIAISALRP